MDRREALMILKVKQDSSQEEIKTSYRKMVLELHPDKNKENYEDINLLTIIKRQLKSYKRWAIFYSKEGTIEYAASNEDNDVEFETTVQKFTEDKNFTVIKSEDEE